MKKWSYILNALLIIVLIMPFAVHAEESIEVDYCNFFLQDSAQTSVEIYLSFANSDLKFLKTDSNYVAQAEITMILYDEAGNFVQELSSEQSIHEIYYNMTLSKNAGNHTLFKVLLNAGNYRLHVYFTDLTNNHTLKLTKEIIVRSKEQDSLYLSDIQVASIIESSEGKSDFVKNGKKIITNTERTFDSNFLYAEFYFEIYNLSMESDNESNSFTFTYYVTDSDGNLMTESSNRFSKPKQTSAINFSVPTRLLDTGEYKLVIEIIDNDSKMSASANTIFFIDKTTFKSKLAEEDEMLEILKNITSRREISKLRRISGHRWKQAMANFWRSKDPTPDTPENEFMIEFYSRLDYVNNAFALNGRKGWKTDRGRIFLRYGSPNRIDRSSEADNWECVEVWNYTDKNLKFVFIDQFGYGDYKLVEHGYSAVVE